MELQLDCLRVRTLRQLARWAIAAFHLSRSLSSLPTVEVPGLFAPRHIVDIDLITGEIYSLVGENGISHTVRLVNFWALSRQVRTVLEHPQGWRHTFGSGLPHDYNVCIGFKP